MSVKDYPRLLLTHQPQKEDDSLAVLSSSKGRGGQHVGLSLLDVRGCGLLLYKLREADSPAARSSRTRLPGLSLLREVTLPHKR